jgi:hypothetical protein
MSQSLAKIYIHLVFSTKGRTDTIPKANLEDVHAYMAEIFNNHGCPAIQVDLPNELDHLQEHQSSTLFPRQVSEDIILKAQEVRRMNGE